MCVIKRGMAQEKRASGNPLTTNLLEHPTEQYCEEQF